ncbi:MAG: cell division protein FtsH, partial [Pseudomonadota bacterium]|nr:cell division protein FtsH [Pseudomonadota bacterium]
EELVFGVEKVTTGAAADIRMVSDTVRRMITEWGMSDKLGFLAYSADQQEVFLGHSVTQQKNVSDATAKIIDEEIRRVTDEAFADARKILEDNRHELDKLGEGLLEYETLTGDEIKRLLAGEEVRSDHDNDRPATPHGGGKSSVPTGGTAPRGGLGSPGDIAPDPQPGD